MQHVELAVLNGELHILHIFIVIFKILGDCCKLLIHLRHILLELIDLAGGAHARNNIFTLRVNQIFTEERFFTRGRVARKGNACAGIFIQVAEHHGLHINGSTPGVGDIVHAAVYVGAGVVPRTENSLDGFHHLCFGIGREISALLLLVILLEALDELLHIIHIEVDIVLNPFAIFDFINDHFKRLFGNFHNNVGEHLDEAAIGVIDEPLEFRIRVACDHACGNLVIQAEVQDGVHHAGHGSARTAAD